MILRLLLVDGDVASREVQALALAPYFDVAVAASERDAVERLEREGAFAAIVCAADVAGSDGIDFLARVRARWPRMGRALTTHAPATSERGSVSEASAALLERAVNEGGVQCVLHAPFESEALISAMRGLVEEARAQALSAALHGLTTDLCGATDVAGIAARSARAAHELLGGRGVRVLLRDANAATGFVEVSLGTVPRWRTHKVVLSESCHEVGRIEVELSNREKLSATEVERVEGVAVPTAASAARVVRATTNDLAQQAILLAMARLAERRDDETGKHLERVSRYCRLIALGLRDDGVHADTLTDEFIENLYRAAPLHDIGKIGIPDAVLLKPGKLDEHEWALMKTHSELGGRAVDDVVNTLQRPGFLVQGSEIAWCHHERWDGTGYPRGLAGEAIPLSARILALADVYDALTSERPYKRAWTHDASVDHIREVSGSHLDPRVVACFLDRLDVVEAIRARYADAEDARRAPLEQLLDVA